MITLIALIISILLQFVAAIYSIRLTKVTKYRLSWILISVGFLFMAIRRFIEFISFLGGDYSQDLGILNNWLGIVTSLLITAGVILITELFNYLKKDYTIVHVTHILRQAKRIADYVVFMYMGEVIEQGTANEIFENPKKNKTKSYLKGLFY